MAMSPFEQMLLCTAAAGACIPAGALLARAERIRPRWLETEFRHFVIAFGGGVLLAAVALVLLPQGLQQVGHLGAAGWLMAGGLLFFGLEWWLGLRQRESPQLLATLLDYIPESLALGGMFAAAAASAPLLALLIGLQNLPEGFNAYRELTAGRQPSRARVLRRLGLLVPIGPLLGALGWHFLAGSPQLLGIIMLLAGGGILYLLFQDIAPMSRLRRHWFPPLGAVCGFALALLGQQLVEG